MSVVQILLIAAVVVYVLGRRFAGSPVAARTALIPLVLIVYGATQLRLPLQPVDIALLAVELVLGAIAGLGRGYTIRLYQHEGHLWQRYTAATLAVWVALIAVRIGFAVGGHALGSTLAPAAAALGTFGLSLLVESLVVARRAAATGTPLLSVPRGRRAGVH